MDGLKAPAKPFQISKQEVWAAWEKVRGNKGAPGVDGVSIGEFEEDLENNRVRLFDGASPCPVSWASV